MEHVFVKYFQQTDLLEPLPHLMMTCKENLAGVSHKIGHYFETGMESFNLTNSYDLIWFQWVVGHLTDYDMVSLLKRCSEALNPGVNLDQQGFIVVKENIPSFSEGFFYDKEDCTVMRGNEYFEKIFEKAELALVISEQFVEFPDDCMPVMKYVLRPKSFGS